jgi:hypothetical protein
MKSNREKVTDLRVKLFNSGVTEEMLLAFLINDHMSGQEALWALEAAEHEFFYNEDDFHHEREHDVNSFDEED